MAFEKTFVPYGMYWSTPFCRWQGSFAHLHPVPFAADVSKAAMAKRDLDPGALDSVILGITVPQKNLFYGGPWFASLLGAPQATGPMIGQACSTGAKCVELAAHEVEMGTSETVLVATTDKTSNGPHLVFPQPHAPGATPDAENWVWDNFGFDPWARNPMIQTAENVAKEASITKEEQDQVALMRFEQYQQALADDSAFLRRFMDLPLEVKDARGKKVVKVLDADEGPFPSTAEGLAKLRPVMPEGTVTFGTQTYPADGNASLIVCSRDKADELSADKNVVVQILSFGQVHVRKGFMATAIVPAAQKALRAAGVDAKDLTVVKTHNPFCVNDIYLSREMGFPLESFNNYGSSLIWGHPQGSTATRLVIEAVEELALKGGGYGLFDGCAAGDTGAALVFKVDVKS